MLFHGKCLTREQALHLRAFIKVEQTKFRVQVVLLSLGMSWMFCQTGYCSTISTLLGKYVARKTTEATQCTSKSIILKHNWHKTEIIEIGQFAIGALCSQNENRFKLSSCDRRLQHHPAQAVWWCVSDRLVYSLEGHTALLLVRDPSTPFGTRMRASLSCCEITHCCVHPSARQ